MENKYQSNCRGAPIDETERCGKCGEFCAPELTPEEEEKERQDEIQEDTTDMETKIKDLNEPSEAERTEVADIMDIERIVATRGKLWVEEALEQREATQPQPETREFWNLVAKIAKKENRFEILKHAEENIEALKINDTPKN